MPRGWCYTAEPYGLGKDEFDKLNSLMSDMRKSGELPLNITAEDKARDFWCDEKVGHDNAEDQVDFIRAVGDKLVDQWTPFSFWDDKEVFLVMVVEKIDLVNLFKPVCDKYRVPIANARGWSDIHIRGNLIMRCRPHIDAGRRVVVLYCGDFDPAGLLIGEALTKNLLDIDGSYYDLSLNKGGGEGREYVWLEPGEIEVVRFGLNKDLVDRLGLSWVDNLKSSNPKKPPLNSHRHPDFKLPYVQEYIRDYCNGHLDSNGFYVTDSPRKCEANTLIVNIEEGRRLCEEAIQEQLCDLEAVNRHESELDSRRGELRAIVNGTSDEEDQL